MPQHSRRRNLAFLPAFECPVADTKFVSDQIAVQAIDRSHKALPGFFFNRAHEFHHGDIMTTVCHVLVPLYSHTGQVRRRRGRANQRSRNVNQPIKAAHRRGVLRCGRNQQAGLPVPGNAAGAQTGAWYLPLSGEEPERSVFQGADQQGPVKHPVLLFA